MVQTRSQTAKAVAEATSIAETTAIYEDSFDEEIEWHRVS